MLALISSVVFFDDVAVAVMVGKLLLMLNIVNEDLTVYHVDRYDEETNKIISCTEVNHHRKHALRLHMEFTKRLEALRLVTQYCEDWQAKKEAKRK